MRKCISSAPDQPRLVLTEKRMLVRRKRGTLHLSQPLGLDTPGGGPKLWCPLGLCLCRRVKCAQTGDMLASGLVSCVSKLSKRSVGEEKEEMGCCTASREFKLWLACVGHEWWSATGEAAHVDGRSVLSGREPCICVSCKGRKMTCVLLVCSSSVLTATLSVLYL